MSLKAASSFLYLITGFPVPIEYPTANQGKRKDDTSSPISSLSVLYSSGGDKCALGSCQTPTNNFNSQTYIVRTEKPLCRADISGDGKGEVKNSEYLAAGISYPASITTRYSKLLCPRRSRKPPSKNKKNKVS